MQNLTEHKDYISLIEESEVHSVTYGINKASILPQLDNFDVTKCLPFDIMHTVYEGVAVYHLFIFMLKLCGPIIYCIAILHNSVAEKGGKIRC